MIRSFSLFTAEIDDPQAAAGEIKAQVDSLPLAAHSVGIVVCHYDYVLNGTIERMAECLPFPLVGITSFYQRVPAANGLFELTVTVLTSDEVRFALALCPMATRGETPANIIRETYRRARDVYGESPSLIFNFLSMNRPVSGDAYLRMMDECSGGVPCFGAVTTGEDESGENNYVICDGAVTTKGFAVLLFIGEVKADFYYGHYKKEKLLAMTATVTKTEGERVLELNAKPALAYLRGHGFAIDDADSDKISNIPFLFKPPGDERPTARTLAGFDPATGALRFLGEIPEKALLRVCSVSIEDVLEVSVAVAGQAVKAHPKAGALFAFSCMGRYITLGLDPTLEMAHVAEALPAAVPYLACYVGGEICPVEKEDGGLANRYHNASFVVCVLE